MKGESRKWSESKGAILFALAPKVCYFNSPQSSSVIK